MKRLFIDMDGTLANFHKNPKFLELMYSEGYFRHLEAFANLTSAVSRLCREKAEEIYILSAVPGCDYSRIVQEKLGWLYEQGMAVPAERCLFPLIGNNKAKYVQEMLGITLTENDVLLDDYNQNLEEWRAAGGAAVKFVNDFNDMGRIGHIWKGERIYYHWNPLVIYDKLVYLCTTNTKDNLHHILIARLNFEFEQFKQDMLSASPGEIFNAAYNITSMQQIKQVIENAIFSCEELEKLNATDGNLLGYLYDAWLDCDTQDFGDLLTVIKDYAGQGGHD